MIQCRNLSKSFVMHMRGGVAIHAFTDVSFNLREGEFVGVSGPSGTGKSSLLKCIYRTYLPTSGHVWYTDQHDEVVDLACADEQTVMRLRAQEIGYVSQFLPVIPRVSALDTITNSMTAKGFAREDSEDKAKDLLERLGIPESLWNMFPSTFSGGEKQRINIIHAVISQPRVLLLDEPTASLDARSAQAVIELVRELKDEGTAMIGVFHDAELLKSLSDRVVHMRCPNAVEVVA